MIPGFQFIYVISLYLPGLPVAIALWRHSLCNYFGPDSFILNVTAGALILGLFIDEFRHVVSFTLERLSKKIFNKNYKYRGAIIFWDCECRPEENKESYLVDRYKVHYYGYEFFVNLASATVLTAIILFQIKDGEYSELIIWLIGAAAISWAFGIMTMYMAKSLVELEAKKPRKCFKVLKSPKEWVLMLIGVMLFVLLWISIYLVTPESTGKMHSCEEQIKTKDAPAQVTPG